MHILVDASNIRKGGGVTHLQEVLRASDFEKYGIERVTVWAPEETLARIGDISRVLLRSHPLINQGRLQGMNFRRTCLDRLIDSDTDLLWAPGGTYLGNFRPYVTMLRNFLPFETSERDRFKYSVDWARLLYLRYAQAKTFRAANGIIHISQKACDVLNDQLDLEQVPQTVIHHGLSTRFLMPPREQRPFEEFTPSRPVRLLYVSHVNLYKHQDKLIEAVARVRGNGIPIELNLVGPVVRLAKRRFDAALAKFDPHGEWVHCHGEVSYEDVKDFYQESDICIFMSTCETFGNILLEAMACGLPILCSNRGALPEVHGGAALEVDPEDIDSVAENLERLVRDKALRAKIAARAFARAQTFSWKRCSDQTLQFLVELGSQNRSNY